MNNGLKSEIIRVPPWSEGRDTGKLFLINEMAAYDAEKWGYRALLALNRGGMEIPQNIAALGMVGVSIIFMNSFLRGNVQFADIEPLLDEMLECVRIIRDPNHLDVSTPLKVRGVPVSPTDIMDVRTIAWLRSEVLRIHTGFSPADALSKLISAVMTPPEDSSNTQTSPHSSDSSSPAEKPVPAT